MKKKRKSRKTTADDTRFPQPNRATEQSAERERATKSPAKGVERDGRAGDARGLTQGAQRQYTTSWRTCTRR